MTFKLTPQAEADISAIVLHIAEGNPPTAFRWVEDIENRCHRLGDMPSIGVARPEVRPELRSFPVGNYLILYREADDGAEIIRIVHGARQWQELL